MSKSQSIEDPIAVYLAKFGKKYPDVGLRKLIRDGRAMTLWAIIMKGQKEYLFTGGVQLGEDVVMIASAVREAQRRIGLKIIVAVPVPKGEADPNWARKSREVRFFLFKPDETTHLDERTARAPIKYFQDVRDVGRPGDVMGFEESEAHLEKHPILRFMRGALGLSPIEAREIPKNIKQKELKLWPGRKKTGSTTSRTTPTPPATKKSKS